jgi:hypothetical protein
MGKDGGRALGEFILAGGVLAFDPPGDVDEFE